MKQKLQPVSIWGIEFDALIDETKSYSSSIPSYTVENGFPVSDTIINSPPSISMTLFITNTPVTWLYRHGSSADRVKRICDMIEEKWMEKQLAKIVTSDTIYTNMGIESISIKKSQDKGYSREISISAKKVRITERQTVSVPSYILQSGESMANAGKAATAKESSKATASSASSGGASSGTGTSSTSNKSSSSSGSKKSTSSGKNSDSKKKQSILYGVADGLGFI